METLRIFIAMLIFAAFSNLEAAVSGFEDIDALSTESVKLRSKAAAEQRAWNSEKSEMLAELSALKEMRGALLEKISRTESEIAEANKQTEIIRRKLSKDESAMRDLDAFLSENSGGLVKNRPGRPPEVCRKKCFGKTLRRMCYIKGNKGGRFSNRQIGVCDIKRNFC